MPKKRGRGGFDPDFNPNRGGGRVGRGRGESSTRGSNRGGGRGRGVSPGGRGGYAHSSAEIDVVVQMWPQNGMDSYIIVVVATSHLYDFWQAVPEGLGTIRHAGLG